MPRYKENLETGKGVEMKKALNLAVDIIYCVFLFWTIFITGFAIFDYIESLYLGCIQPHSCVFRVIVSFWCIRFCREKIKMRSEMKSNGNR